MSTASREKLAKMILQDAQKASLHPPHHHPAHASHHPHHYSRHPRLRPLPSPSADELKERELGWNDRFYHEPPAPLAAPRRGRERVSSASSEQKRLREKKIQDERLQYGDHTKHKTKKHSMKKAPVNNRLQPLGAVPMMPKQAAAVQDLTAEEKLRFKVLKTIDARETLIYQLNALILCTPVQEALVAQVSRPLGSLAAPEHGRKGGSSPNKPTGPVVNSREATKMAQQLASELQMAGIQCVEALVEWMLEAGAKAENPPPFLWRGQNYFVKMFTDLDFAGPELSQRGIELDCFTPRNPMLIRPDQKLGRVLAAHSIVIEMIGITADSEKPANVFEPKPEQVKAPSPVAKQPLKAETDPPTRPIIKHESADVMITRQDESENEYEQDLEEDEPAAEVKDTGGDHELVAELDQSMSEFKARAPAESPPKPHQDVPSAAPEVMETVALATEIPPEKPPTPEKSDPMEILCVEISRVSGHSIAKDVLATALAWHSTASIHTISGVAADGLSKSLLIWIQNHMDATAIPSIACSAAGQELQFASSLLTECRMVVNVVFQSLADRLELLLQNPEVQASELDMNDIIECLKQSSAPEHIRSSVWAKVQFAMRLYHQLQASGAPEQSQLSRIFVVCYPYITTLARDEGLGACGRLVKFFDKNCGLPRQLLLPWLDPTIKALLLNASLVHEDDQYDTFPKLSIVCERGNVVFSSLHKLQPMLSSVRPMPHHVLFPFFRSSFGEKMVDGVAVEEGEGKGPLKEWFVLISEELTSKWKRVLSSPSPTAKIEVEGNKMRFKSTKADTIVRVGWKVGWRKHSEHIVLKIEDDHTVLLDSVSSRDDHDAHTTIRVQDLEIWQPQQAYWHFIQSSQSFWINEQLQESEDHRHVLRFVGWYLANAIWHYVKLDLHFHILFWRFLMNDHHVPSLEDVQSLDPTWYKSIHQVRLMPRSSLEEFLQLEGLPRTMSDEEYEQHVLRERFGDLKWQFRAVRDGFSRVFGMKTLTELAISPLDLANIVSAAPEDGKPIDLQRVFRVAEDPEFTKCVILKETFWDVVNGFDNATKRKLIKFVTGIDTLPLAGTEFLRIEIPFSNVRSAEFAKTLHMLPQSHTCDNVLELPQYWKALCHIKGFKSENDPHARKELRALLQKKLMDAMDYSSGYGLDGTTAIASVLKPKAEDDAMPLAQDSCESLDLPAIGDGEDTKDVVVDPPQVAVRVTSPQKPPSRAIDDESYGDSEWEDEEA